MIRFVLNNFRLSPPCALYQFGHETKVAATAVLFTLLRRFGKCWEPFVSVDGTHPFDAFSDSLIHWLRGKSSSNPLPPLWPVNKAFLDIERRLEAGERLSPEQIAADYIYPLEYVQACLWPQLKAKTTALPGIHMP